MARQATRTDSPQAGASRAGTARNGRTVKAPGAFRTISEVAGEIDVPQHVLRFWETKFAQVRPLKRAGGRRYYRPEDVALLARIRALLYDEGYTIKGVQRLLRAGGLKALDQPTLSEAAASEAAAAGAGEAAAGEAQGKPAAEQAGTPAGDVRAEGAVRPASAPAGAAGQGPAAAADPGEAPRLRAELRRLRGELAALRDLLRAGPRRR